jgi:hypothetical protein
MRKRNNVISEIDKMYIYNAIKNSTETIGSLVAIMELSEEQIRKVYRLEHLKYLAENCEKEETEKKVFVRQKGIYSNRSPMGIATEGNNY